jgi:hypothetical protein
MLEEYSVSEPDLFDSRIFDPFEAFADLEPQEQTDFLLSLVLSLKGIRGFVRQLPGHLPPDELRELKRSPTVFRNGLTVNRRVLSLIDRKSILYMSNYQDSVADPHDGVRTWPKASRTELAAIFGVSQQRVSQIIGAQGHSKADAALLDQFARAKPGEHRDHWRVEAHFEKLHLYREGRIAAVPLSPRHMTPSAIGRWTAYGLSFEVYERAHLFYFLIDLTDELESEPRATAQKALDDCLAACREEAWANSSGDRDEWLALYKEDPFGPAAPANLVRTS